MGRSVMNQVDSTKYFSISTVNARSLKDNGITINLSTFKEIVRRTPPYTQITTGSDQVGKFRITKIYRYEDFKQEKEVVL